MIVFCMTMVFLLCMVLSFMGGMYYHHKKSVSSLITNWAEHTDSVIEDGDTRVAIRVLKVTQGDL